MVAAYSYLLSVQIQGLTGLLDILKTSIDANTLDRQKPDGCIGIVAWTFRQKKTGFTRANEAITRTNSFVYEACRVNSN